MFSVALSPLLWKRALHSHTKNTIISKSLAGKERKPAIKPDTIPNRLGAVGFKVGMLTHYDDWGKRTAATAIHLSDCQALRSFKNHDVIVQEVGVGHKSRQQLRGSLPKMYEDLDVDPKLRIHGYVVKEDAVLAPGTPIFAGHFVAGQYVDVKSRSIGKGFQGVMKRWKFKGQPASHGASLSHRSLGSTGNTDAGKVFKGKKMPGRMGGRSATVCKRQILKVDHAMNCVIVSGPVPGHKNCIVRIYDSKYNPLFTPENPPPFPTFFPNKNNMGDRYSSMPAAKVDPLEIQSQK